MRRVDDEDVVAGGDQRLRALESVVPDPDHRSDAQASLRVLSCMGIADAILDVLDRDQPLELKVLVDDQKLFDPVAAQDVFRLFDGRPDRCGHDSLFGYRGVNRLIEIVEETDIAIREDSDETPVFGYRYSGDVLTRLRLRPTSCRVSQRRSIEVSGLWLREQERSGETDSA